MTTFEDGPAKGKTLMLKRFAHFLRVVEVDGKFDALDQLTDTPEPHEKIYAYEISGAVGGVHINARVGPGGFYPLATFKFVKNQPADAEMRTSEAWAAWVERNKPK